MTIASLFRDSVASLWTRPGPAKDLEPEVDPLDLAHAPPDIRRLIRDRRYCRVLVPSDGLMFDPESMSYAWKAAALEMAYVPTGQVTLSTDLAVANQGGFEFEPATYENVPVESIHIDRTAVTNADFLRFVTAGGYSNADLWPSEVLSTVLQFTDQTNRPGPRYWNNGQPPQDRLTHPVVGICWYEANAYAIWAGKRLPTSAEWQRAGTWGRSQGDLGREPRYPWGDAYDPSKTNTWTANRSETAPVNSFPEGDTPNGVRQLVGNVWEWIDAQFSLPGDGDIRLVVEQPMAEIRGGAYDTYFHSQATCQFRSGQPLLHRAANIGFRCCISTDLLPPEPDPEPSLQGDAE